MPSPRNPSHKVKRNQSIKVYRSEVQGRTALGKKLIPTGFAGVSGDKLSIKGEINVIEKSLMDSYGGTS
jgi:hypothetical protein